MELLYLIFMMVSSAISAYIGNLVRKNLDGTCDESYHHYNDEF